MPIRRMMGSFHLNRSPRRRSTADTKRRAIWTIRSRVVRQPRAQSAEGESPLFLQRATKEFVHRLSGIQHLLGDLAAANGQLSVKCTDLDEHRSLVPVDVLVRHL